MSLSMEERFQLLEGQIKELKQENRKLKDEIMILKQENLESKGIISGIQEFLKITGNPNELLRGRDSIDSTCSLNITE